MKNLCPPRDYGNDVEGRGVTTGLMSGKQHVEDGFEMRSFGGVFCGNMLFREVA